MHNFKKLNIWKTSIELITDIYKLTEKFPDREIYGLTSQMRRCAVSIPSNIAEGAGRQGKKEFKQFLGYSYASCCELETQLIIAKNLNFINETIYNQISRDVSQVEKMIFALSKNLQ